VIGNRTRVRVTKNKVAPPFRVAEFDIMYDEGISKAGDLLDMAVETGIIAKRGSYFYLGEEMLAQGRENAKQALRDPATSEPVDASVRDKLTESRTPKPGPPRWQNVPQTAGALESASG
jgi:recombination protein RecA